VIARLTPLEIIRDSKLTGSSGWRLTPGAFHRGFGNKLNGLFVVFLNFGTSILAASLTLSIMTQPVIITRPRRRCRCAAVIPCGGDFAGRHAGGSNPACGLPQALPGSVTGVILVGRRLVNAPILFTGAAFFLPHCRSPQWMRTMACLTIVRHHDAVPGMPTASIWHRAGTAAFVLGDEYCRDGDSIARPGAPQCEENGKTL